MSPFLNRISNWKSLLLLVALYILFPVYFLKNAEATINELAGSNIGVIDLTFSFAPDRTLDMVSKYGDAARAEYARIESTTDLAYPIVYAFLFGIILTLLFRNTNLSQVNILPFICMCFDFVENVSIIILLNSYPNQSRFVAILCEIFKTLKWSTFVILLGLIIYGVVKIILGRMK